MPVIIPTLSTIDLQYYITGAQRLLHDSTFRFYTQTELTDYANDARKVVAADTGCLRQIVTGYNLVSGQSTIQYTNDIILGRRVIGLLDLYTFYSVSARYPLRYYPYSQFARSASVMYSYQGIPAMWSQVGGMAYLSPVPQVDYVCDFDASIEPLDLVNLTDVDNEVLPPFSQCVKFYMCYLAKLKDQKRQEAEAFLFDYAREKGRVSSSTNIRKLVGQ